SVARAAAQRRGALRRAHRRRRQGVLQRHRPSRDDRRPRQAAGSEAEVTRLGVDAVHVRRSRRQHRSQDERPLEAGDRRGQRHRLRRRLLHARRGRVHHRGGSGDVFRPARDLRHDRGLRAHAHAAEDAVPRDHAPVAARQLRAAVGQARVRGRPGVRGRSRRQAPRSRGVGREDHRLATAVGDPEHGACDLGGPGSSAYAGAVDGVCVRRSRHQQGVDPGRTESLRLEGPAEVEASLSDRRVAIVGAALSDIGRVDDKTSYELHWQATSRALADAGLGKQDVGGFMSQGTGMLPPVELTEYMGMRPTWVDSTGVGGATWEFMVEHAYAAIAQRLTDVVVLAYGSTARADLKKKLRSANLSFGTRGPAQFDAPWGHTLIAKYAMAARRHMHEFGTKIEELAEIAVSARHNAALNPEAFYREPITVDDVMNSGMIADPFTKLHCCIRSDGGGAIVLASAERARDCAKTPVWVLGTGEAVS